MPLAQLKKRIFLTKKRVLNNKKGFFTLLSQFVALRGALLPLNRRGVRVRAGRRRGSPLAFGVL